MTGVTYKPSQSVWCNILRPIVQYVLNNSSHVCCDTSYVALVVTLEWTCGTFSCNADGQGNWIRLWYIHMVGWSHLSLEHRGRLKNHCLMITSIYLPSVPFKKGKSLYIDKIVCTTTILITCLDCTFITRKYSDHTYECPYCWRYVMQQFKHRNHTLMTERKHSYHTLPIAPLQIAMQQ